ncbi:MAG: hypothetical protein ACYTG0_42795 [Planctomycetota bacterium]|jgi:hypothetical protein
MSNNLPEPVDPVDQAFLDKLAAVHEAAMRCHTLVSEIIEVLWCAWDRLTPDDPEYARFREQMIQGFRFRIPRLIEWSEPLDVLPRGLCQAFQLAGVRAGTAPARVANVTEPSAHEVVQQLVGTVVRWAAVASGWGNGHVLLSGSEFDRTAPFDPELITEEFVDRLKLSLGPLLAESVDSELRSLTAGLELEYAVAMDQREQATTDQSGEPESAAEASGDNEGEAMLSAPDLAKKYGVDPEALSKRLERFRAHTDHGWIEAQNPGQRKPRYLYRVASVKYIIDEMLD